MMLLRLILFTNLLLCFCFSLSAQTSVGVYGSSLTVSPSNTVSNGTTISVTGLIQNTGTTTITDYLHINIAIDTSTTGIPKYYQRSTVTYFVTNFAPSTTHTFVITDVGSTANHYFCCGDGTTVIIWPLVGNPTNTISTHDSANTIVYITTTNGLEDFNELDNNSVKLKNPLTENTLLSYNHSVYNHIEFININGELVLNAIVNDILQVENLSQGLYLLKLYNPNTNRIVTKKILIE